MRIQDFEPGVEYSFLDNEDDSQYKAKCTAVEDFRSSKVACFTITESGTCAWLKSGEYIEVDQTDIDDGLLDITKC